MRAGDVLGLDAISRHGDGSADADLVVAYRDGSVDCISGDLAKTLWEHTSESVGGDTSPLDEVEYSVITDLETARKGLLADRDDVLTLVDPLHTSQATPSAHTLLCQIVRSQTCRRLRLYSVHVSSADSIQRHRATLQQLLSYELPATKKQGVDRASYELHVATGKLYQLLDGNLVLYDLATTVPRFLSKFGSKASPIRTFARLSQSSVLTVSHQRIALYETRYGALRAMLVLPSLQSAPSQSGSKRKHADGDLMTAPLCLVASYSDLGLVLALSGSRIQGLQLATNMRETKRSRASGAMLIDVFGKGNFSGAKSMGNQENSEKRERKWKEWTRKVDEAVDGSDSQELVSLTAHALRLHHKTPLQQASSKQDSVNVDETDGAPWDLDPRSISIGQADHRKVLYLLSRCVRVGGDGDHSRLRITTTSGLVLKMFALSGFLSTAYCQQALQQHANGNNSPSNILPGSIMASIRWFDDDFQLMHDMLTLPVHWEIEDVLSALQLLIQSFDTQAQDEPTRLALPAPQLQPDGLDDIAMMDGDGAESHIESESLAAEKELHLAMSALSSGLELRSQTLRLVLGRLHAFSRKLVTKAMRETLSHKDLVFFIHILRIELADGGWTSRYIDKGEGDRDEADVAPWMDGADEASGPSDQAIKAIGDLMTCAMDAIGTAGFLVGLSADSYNIHDLLSSLRTEVSAGLEGLYEVDVLETALREMGRYAAQTGRSRRQSFERASLDGDLKGPEEKNAMLPFARLGVGRKSTSRDARKSKQLRAKEKSMRVGKYSIDRIRL